MRTIASASTSPACCVEVLERHVDPGAQLHELTLEQAVDQVGVPVRPSGPALVGIREEIGIVVPAHAHPARRPLCGELAGRASPLLLGVGLDVALVEDRPHQLEAPLLEVRRLRALLGVQALPLLQLTQDLVAARLRFDVREEDRPVQDLALHHDVDPVAVIVERRHRVRELPDLTVLGVEDVRPVRLVEHALDLLRPDQAARDPGPFEQHRLDAVAREAVGEGAAGQSGPHDQDSAHARNATGHARRPHEVRSATMTL